MSEGGGEEEEEGEDRGSGRGGRRVKERDMGEGGDGKRGGGVQWYLLWCDKWVSRQARSELRVGFEVLKAADRRGGRGHKGKGRGTWRRGEWGRGGEGKRRGEVRVT